MLTPKQYKLLTFINKSVKEHGCCPSFEEMKEAAGLKSKSGIHALIESLIERGFIRKLPHKARALEVIKMPKYKPSAIIEEERKSSLQAANSNIANGLSESYSEIPLYGKIAAGTPIEAIANEQERIQVPTDMLTRGDFYALTIDGESMKEGGILDGDTVIIKKVDTARNGEIIVALVDDNEATLKVFKRERNQIMLIPQNSRYETQILEASRVKIQGVLAGLMRKY